MVQKMITNTMSKLMLPVLAMSLICTSVANTGGLLDTAAQARNQFLGSTKYFFEKVSAPIKPLIEVPAEFLGKNLSVRTLQLAKIGFIAFGGAVLKSAIDVAGKTTKKDKRLDALDSTLSTLDGFRTGGMQGALETLLTGKLLQNSITFGGALCSFGGSAVTAGKLNALANPTATPANVNADVNADATASASQVSAQSGCSCHP